MGVSKLIESGQKCIFLTTLVSVDATKKKIWIEEVALEFTFSQMLPKVETLE